MGNCLFCTYCGALNDADTSFCVKCGHIMPVRADKPAQGTTPTPSSFVPKVPDGFYLAEDGEIYPLSHRDEAQESTQGTKKRVNLSKPGYPSVKVDSSSTLSDAEPSKVKHVTSRLADSMGPEIPEIRKATAYGVHYGSSTPPGASYKMPDVEVYTSIPAPYMVQNAPAVYNMGTVQDKMSWNVTLNRIRLAVIEGNYDRALNTVGYLRLSNPTFDTAFLNDVILNTRREMEFVRRSRPSVLGTIKAVALGIGAGILGLISLSLCSNLAYDIESLLFYSPFAITGVIINGVALLATSCGGIACLVGCILQARRLKSTRYTNHAYPVDSQHAIDCQDYLLKVLDDLYIR